MDLLTTIEAAFSDVPPPLQEDLIYKDSCHCEECCESVSQFVGKDWRHLTLEDAVSDQQDAVIANLSPTAF